ncbi:MAG: CRISPR-associated endonuclease Cas2 [Campylobacterota bacterium]|nr:CRISPR-associated endonuclease Cas2 [Campylobacterota bacterium]
MKRFNFLICYDIANPKRLARVAKTLEKVSIRIQKSQFYSMDTTKEECINIVKKLEEIINNDEDDVRIYKVDKHSSVHLNGGINLLKPNIIGGDR